MVLLSLDALLSSTRWISHLWSMLFACLLFLYFFFIRFLPGSPFRVFNPPGNKSFSLPLFLPELPLKVVNPSGCSFLPKPPFRVFNLASLFIFVFSFCFFILAIDHRPYWGESLLVICIEMDINTHLFMHVSFECT